MLGITVLLVVRTEWFRDYVRNKIITYAEQSTGGTVELQKFGFDWTRLHANLTGFVLHGTEPAGAAPLFSAQSIDVNLKLFTSMKHMLDIFRTGLLYPVERFLQSSRVGYQPRFKRDRSAGRGFIWIQADCGTNSA